MNSCNVKIIFILLVALFVLACNAGSLSATTTPVPTNTHVPTKTVVLVPSSTSTSWPTATLEPTPVPMGYSVQSKKFEVKVIDAIKRDRVYPGGKFDFTAIKGYVLVDVGIKVTNVTTSSIWRVKWGDMCMTSAKQDCLFPYWGAFVDTSDDIDPFTIGVSEIVINPAAEITLKKTGYLRLFYHIPKKEIYYFSFENSPFTEIKFK